MNTVSADKSEYRQSGKIKALNKLNAVIVFVRIFCGIYVLADLIFWVAYISNKVNTESVYYLAFMPIWKLSEIFYTYNPGEGGDETDFTGLVSVSVLIVFIVIIKSLSDIITEYIEVEQLKEIRRHEKKMRKLRAEQNEAQLNPNSQGFIFLIKTDIEKEEGFLYEQKMHADDVNLLRTKFRSVIMSNINKNNIVKKGLYRNNLFIFFNDIKYADEFIDYIRKTLAQIAGEFSSPDTRVNFIVVFDVIDAPSELNKRVETCEIINYLNFKNEFLCTKEFRDAYMQGLATSYAMSPKGVYNLSRNLNIVNNKELFSLKLKQ